MKLSDIGGAAFPMELNGETFMIHPPTVGDLSEAERWAASLPFSDIKPMLDSGSLTPDERKMLIERAFEESQQITAGSPKFVEKIGSMRGLSYMLWLCARKSRPELKIEDLAGRVTMANVDKVEAVIDMLSGMGDSTESDPTTEDPSDGKVSMNTSQEASVIPQNKSTG